MTQVTPVEEQLAKLRATISGMGIEELMRIYRSTETSKRQVKSQLDTISDMLDIIESEIDDYLIASNQRGAVTDHGKVERKVKSTFYVSDKVAFRDWAIANKMEELMTISVAQRAIKDFVETQYQEHLRLAAESGTTTETFVPTLPDGLATKDEFKLSITKVK